jgi:hypothetical protein
LCSAAFEGVDTVFHTAAPDPTNNDFQLHYKVNVEGKYSEIMFYLALEVWQYHNLFFLDLVKGQRMLSRLVRHARLKL